MKKNNIGYLLREGIRSVFLHGFMSFAAIWVTVACLLIMGTFGLVLFNIDHMVGELERENQILVFVEETYTRDNVQKVGTQINRVGNVLKAELKTKQDALRDFVREQQDESLFEGLDASTFRDRYVVSLDDPSQMRQTCEQIRQIEGVADIRAHYEIAEGFQMIQQVLGIASMIIIAVLLVVSVLIISNTVKLAMYDRKEEIAIMKMVGATNGFIRWPFVVEGFILGFVAAVLAFFLQWGLYNFLNTQIGSLDTMGLFKLVPFKEVIEVVAACYAVVGFVVGVIGSMLSIRKFLKV